VKYIIFLIFIIFSACEDSSTSSQKEEIGENEIIETVPEVEIEENITEEINDTIEEIPEIEENITEEINDTIEEIPEIEENITEKNNIGGVFSEDTLFPPNTDFDTEIPVYIEPEIEIEILEEKEVKTLSGKIGSKFLSNSYYWKIVDEVSVFGKLEIEAGTTLFGETSNSILTIEKGGEIWAVGNAKSPILFTSFKKFDPLWNYNNWGGLRIFGDENSSSGALKFVQIDNGGSRNYHGLLLDEVGEMLIEYLFVNDSQRDGIYIVGGDVNLRHTIIFGAKGDSLVIDNDWSGKMQNIYIKQERGNFGDDSAGLQIGGGTDQNMIISNLTIESENSSSGDGIHLKSGSYINIYNSLVTGYRSGVCIRAEDSLENIANYDFNSSVLGLCGGGTFLSTGGGKDILKTYFSNGENNISKALSLSALSKLAKPVETNSIDSWFDDYKEEFLGAFYTDSNRTWWSSWLSE
jgi:hypothetical protein